MRNLDDLRLSLSPAPGGGVMDVGVVKSAVGRAEADGQFADLMSELSEQFPTPEAELERFVARFAERCILAGIDQTALADTMIISGALIRTATEGREAAAATLRAVADGIGADGA